MIHVNGPDTKIHVGACGGVGWPVNLKANGSCPDLSVISNALLWVRRPSGSAPEIVTWDLTFAAGGTNTLRPAYYKFRGVDVAQDPPDLPVPGDYVGFVQVDFGNGIWVRFSDDMTLKVSSNP